MSKEKVKEIQHFDLKSVTSPDFLKNLNYNQLNVLASDIRSEIIDVTSRLGGHLSSNLGVVESMIALHRVFDFKTDRLLIDVGHQSYTHKILTGRSLDTLRQKNGISGFQKLNESIYDAYEAGHSSTSISAANGMAIARDYDHKNFDIVAFIGDASIVNGMAFEALNNVMQEQHKHKIIIVLNDNEMSISKPVGGMGKFFARISTSAAYTSSKKRYKRIMDKTRIGHKVYNVSLSLKNSIKHHLVPTTLFDNLGFNFLGPIDGHDIKAIEKALIRSKRSTHSVVIHIRTIKGKGYSFAENDKNGYWHGVTPFEIETGKPKILRPDKVSWSHLFSDLIVEKLSQEKDMFVVVPGTVKGSGLENVFEANKDRCIDVGIAEEHCVTMSSGLSVAGKHPVISIYSTFMQRAFDQISHDVARMNLDITFLVDRSGLVGADGETHQGIYDEAFLVSTPNTTVSMPSTIQEAKMLFNESFNHHGPFFIRYPRDYVIKKEPKEQDIIKYGKWFYELKGNSNHLVVVSYGQIINCLKQLMIDESFDATLINAIYQKPMDEEMISSLLNYDNIVIYSAYATEYGFVNTLKCRLEDLGYKGKIHSYSIPCVYVKQATITQQMEDFGLLPNQIFDKIKNI